MKFILKILFAPVMLFLWLFTGLCTLILKLSVMLLSVVAVLFAVMGVITIATDSVLRGCIGLAVAFLFCPYGLPMLATRIVAQFCIFRLWLREVLYE